MYETPRSKLINAEKEIPAYKIVKGINLFLLLTFFGVILLKVIMFPGFESGIGFRVFMSIILSLFMVPYLLAMRAFPPLNRMRKGAIITSIIWCLFIVVGVSVQQQGVFVNSVCALLLLVSVINIFLLTKHGKAAHPNS